MTVFHVAKYIVRSRSTTTTADVPRGHLAVYVGESPDERHRFVVPISYLNHPLFHDLLSLAEEEYGFRHPTEIQVKIPTWLEQMKAPREMAIRLFSILGNNAKQFQKLQSVNSRHCSDVPKGHLAVYVGELEKRRYVVPIAYLKHPRFQMLLKRAEEEFGFDHPTGGLTLPCKEDAFLHIISLLN
nr:auxin-induced protein 10A5-like [Ipomoea batatas]